MPPFTRPDALGITPEDAPPCTLSASGAENAARMLGPEGWKPTAEEARDAGFVEIVAPHDALVETAAETATQWIAEGKQRTVIVDGTRDELKAVNAQESEDLADAFLGEPFLRGQEAFLRSKGKSKAAGMFGVLASTRPLWSKLL